MHNHNDDTIKTSDTVLRKIYLSLYLKGLSVRGNWRPNRTATYWLPLLWPSAFRSRSPGLLNRGPGAQPLWVLIFSTASYLQLVWSPNCSIGGMRAPSAGCWLYLPHLFSNWSGLQTNWLPVFTEVYNSSTPPSSCKRHNFALIQPVHGQGYNILIIPRPDSPVIYTGAFPIFTARPGRRSIYNRSSEYTKKNSSPRNNDTTQRDETSSNGSKQKSRKLRLTKI